MMSTNKPTMSAAKNSKNRGKHTDGISRTGESTNSTHVTLSKWSTVIIFAVGFYLFFATLILAPFVNTLLFATYYVTTKLVLVAIGALLSILQLWFVVPRVSRRQVEAAPKNVKIAAGALLLFFGASILFSSSLKTSLFGLYTAWENNMMTYLMFILIGVAWWNFFVVAKLYKFEKQLFHLLISLVVLVTSLYGIGEYYFWHLENTYVSNGIVRLTLGFSNPLFSAYFIGMLWSYQFIASLEQLQNKSRTFLNTAASLVNLILFAGITHVFILTFTRSAWIAAAATALTLLGFSLWNNRKDTQTILRTIVTTLLLALIVFLQGYVYRNKIAERNTDLKGESTQTLSSIAASLGKSDNPDSAMAFFQKAGSFTSSQIRLMEWTWSIRTLVLNPKNILFGVGPDSAFFEMPKTRDPIVNNIPTDATVKPQYIRNLYLNFLLEHGVLATMATVVFAFLLIKTLFKNSFTIDKKLAILVAYLAQGVFYYPTLLTTVFVIFSLAYFFASNADTEMQILRNPNKSEKFILVSLLTLLLVWIIPVIKAEFALRYYASSVYPAKETEMAANSKILLDNNILKRYYTYYYYNTDLGKKYLEELSTSNDMDDLRIAADAYYLWARKENSTELTQKSITTFERLLTIEKTLPSTWDGLGLRYLYIHQYDKALVDFKKAIELKEDYWYAYLHIGETLRQQCKPQEAITWYEKAKEFVPSATGEINEAKEEVKTPRAECKP